MTYESVVNELVELIRVNQWEAAFQEAVTRAHNSGVVEVQDVKTTADCLINSRKFQPEDPQFCGSFSYSCGHWTWSHSSPPQSRRAKTGLTRRYLPRTPRSQRKKFG